MGSEVDAEPKSTPKLSLYSLPSKPPEPPGMLTPPIQASASVPFHWEEAPGKPRACSTSSSNPRIAARCLELPPRLLTEAKITNVPSPTTVMDGPYVGQPVSRSFRAHFAGEVGGPSVAGKREHNRSWRWSSLKENRGGAELSFDFSATLVNERGGGETDKTKVKITRIKRRESFLGVSMTRSQLWVSATRCNSPYK